MSVLTDTEIERIAYDHSLGCELDDGGALWFDESPFPFARAIEAACQPQWCPVSDPPPTHRVVLVWPTVVTARLEQQGTERSEAWLACLSGRNITNFVTHWMPLPEGPTP